MGHFILQTSLQFGAYANNRSTSSRFEGVVSNTTLITRPFSLLESNGDLSLCADIPQRFGGPDTCIRRSFDGSTSRDSKRPVARRITATAELDENNAITEVDLTGVDPAQPNAVTNVDLECVQTFPWILDVYVESRLSLATIADRVIHH